MRMHRFATLALFAGVAALAAAYEIPFRGNFAAKGPDGFPSDWVWYDEGDTDPEIANSRSWSHSQAKVEGGEGGNELHLFAAKEGKGTVLRSRQRIPGRADDILTVTAEVRGKGLAGMTVFGWNAKGGLARGLPEKLFDLSDEWKEVSATFTLSDYITAVASYEVVLVMRPGADARFRNVRVSRRLEVERMLNMDDYESSAARSGDPEIVSGDIAPGLLSKTRQGVYRTSGRVDIVPAGRVEMPPPGEFITSGVRIYGFDEGGEGRVVTRFEGGGGKFVFAVGRNAGNVVCGFTGGGRMSVPATTLPADFVFSASRDGVYELVITSLANSQTTQFDGSSEFFRAAAGGVSRSVSLVASPNGKAASATVDNVFLAVSRPERLAKIKYPFTAKVLPEFDPVKAGWPLVFSDEFDGTEVDSAKWDMSNEKNREYSRVEDGRLKIITDYAPGSTNTLKTASLWTNRKFLYGYFEARLKFTTYNGWWAAFWLCSRGIGNSFLNGLEIDIFEDYYMRNPSRNTLDHNLHVGGGVLKSWNYNSKIPGTYRDWYTIGCKWTPFEITYYINGRAIPAKSAGSPYDSVTFDAFRCGTGIMPLHAIVSGQIMRTAYGKHDPEPDEVFPELYEVDYVRIYGYPGAAPGAAPEVALHSRTGDKVCIKNGMPISLRATVKPASGTEAKIKAVYLFDSGYYIGMKTEPPYDFEFPFSDSYFSKTKWSLPGRSGLRPGFKGSMHVFSAFAEDENGEVGHSPTILRMVASDEASRPYLGEAAVLPGVIKIGRYDEGGQGVAYSDATKANTANKTWRASEGVDCGEDSVGNIETGEWLKYTVDVKKAGRYRVKMRYGTPCEFEHRVDMFLDDMPLGRVGPLRRHKATHWGADTVAETEVTLPAGRHVLRLLMVGQFNLGNIEFGCA
ncbi:MAG: family 16 glycosylhydrolase, partial [Kiritimatiellae bacterium]|nr:family 16 glycosylhydrolase [Kiritimatiellia bacterium]